MEAKTRKKIEAVIEEAASLAEQGWDEYDAARDALMAQTSDVLKELATAAVVDAVRRRQRSNVLNIERDAERTPQPKREQPSWKTPEYYAAEQERAARFGAELRTIIENYTEAVRLEWTTELLASDFALADGTRVTWGDATIGQHEQRAALFQRNALANAEGAARHLKAIEALKAAGVSTLAEMVGVAA